MRLLLCKSNGAPACLIACIVLTFACSQRATMSVVHGTGSMREMTFRATVAVFDLSHALPIHSDTQDKPRA